MALKSRLPGAETSIFTRMSRLAQEHGAINLSQGFPDFPIDPLLADLVHKAMRDGSNQYAPMAGLMSLREEIARVVEESYGRKTNPDLEITITAGGTEALFMAIAAVVHAGDEVIIFDPSFDTYAPAVLLNGGIPVHLNMLPPDFGIPWEALQQAINSRTRLIIVNSPHNPCGTVLSSSDLDRLAAICIANQIYLLSDEVYERIIFDGLQHQSVLSRPELHPWAMAVFSFGKTFHVTGWKSGYVVAATELTAEMRKVHQNIIFCTNTPVQVAFTEYIKNSDHYMALGEFYQQKRNFFLEQLQQTPLKPLPCNGSYFQVLSYGHLNQLSDLELAVRLTREAGIATIPVSNFYADHADHHLLRLCFAKKEETLEAAGRKLGQIDWSGL